METLLKKVESFSLMFKILIRQRPYNKHILLIIFVFEDSVTANVRHFSLLRCYLVKLISEY